MRFTNTTGNGVCCVEWSSLHRTALIMKTWGSEARVLRQGVCFGYNNVIITTAELPHRVGRVVGRGYVDVIVPVCTAK